MSVETNFNQVAASRLSVFDDLQNGDKIFREAALNTVALISDRVQQRGEKTDGSKITTKATKKTGAYSKQYGNKRKELGYQTSIIDQTLTGQMMDNFIPEPEGKTNYVVGFRGKEASDKAEWNEDYFGTIYELSSKEANSILSIINKRIDAVFRSGNS